MSLGTLQTAALQFDDVIATLRRRVSGNLRYQTLLAVVNRLAMVPDPAVAGLLWDPQAPDVLYINPAWFTAQIRPYRLFVVAHAAERSRRLAEASPLPEAAREGAAWGGPATPPGPGVRSRAVLVFEGLACSAPRLHPGAVARPATRDLAAAGRPGRSASAPAGPPPGLARPH